MKAIVCGWEDIFTVRPADAHDQEKSIDRDDVKEDEEIASDM